MEGAASESSDWEVLSAPGGDDDVVLVSREGGDILHDHFALVLSDVGFSGKGSWSGAASDDEGKEAALELMDRLDWISGERLNLTVEDSSVQLQVGVADESAESSVLDAAVAGGATWSTEERKFEAIHSEVLDQEKNAAHSCGESDSILQPLLHHGVVESLDSDLAMVADGSQSEVLENSDVRLEDGGLYATRGGSVLEGVVTGGGMQSAREDQEQGENASATTCCGESDGEVKDGSLPLVQTPGTGEGEASSCVVEAAVQAAAVLCLQGEACLVDFHRRGIAGASRAGEEDVQDEAQDPGPSQIQIAFDEKRASQLADHASRLSEAFLIARHVPAQRTSSGVALPWSMAQDR